LNHILNSTHIKYITQDFKYISTYLIHIIKHMCLHALMSEKRNDNNML